MAICKNWTVTALMYEGQQIGFRGCILPIWVICAGIRKDPFVFESLALAWQSGEDPACAFLRAGCSPSIHFLQAVLLSELHLRWKESLLWPILKISTGFHSGKVRLLWRHWIISTLATERKYCFLMVFRVVFAIPNLTAFITEDILKHTKVPFITNIGKLIILVQGEVPCFMSIKCRFRMYYTYVCMYVLDDDSGGITG